jgi:hypothetical protein
VIYFDVLVYLAVAKVIVLLWEDASYAARGKQSPRRQARARQQAAAQKAAGDGPAGASAPAGAGRTASGSTVAAANGYFAGLIEDATDRARARRRRAVARKRGTQAVDGVVVDVDEDGRWYADCDLCGWASRPFRIEANAQGAGREHTRIEHPEQYTGEPKDTQGGGAGGDSVESAADGAGEQTPGRPVLRVIPGGAQEPAPPAGQQPAAAAQPVASAPAPKLTTKEWPQRFHHTKCDRCGKTSVTAEMPRRCPSCGADDSRLQAVPDPAPAPDIATFRWRCPTCDATETGFATRPAADAAAAKHTCPPKEVPTYYWRCPKCRAYGSGFASKAGAEAAGAQHTCVTATETPAPSTPTDTPAPTTQADRERLRTELYGKCAHREAREGLPDQWCDTPVGADDGPYCAEHKTSGADAEDKTSGTGVGDKTSGADAGDDQHHPAADPAAGTSSTTKPKEQLVNLEATGPEEIRAAFSAAAEAAGENAETVSGIAGVMTEAADRYEGLEMAASTVGHLRDAAEQFASAASALNSAHEELQAALSDFNSKDGAVAEVVADAGGNVASKEVLVG